MDPGLEFIFDKDNNSLRDLLREIIWYQQRSFCPDSRNYSQYFCKTSTDYNPWNHWIWHILTDSIQSKNGLCSQILLRHTAWSNICYCILKVKYIYKTSRSMYLFNTIQIRHIAILNLFKSKTGLLHSSWNSRSLNSTHCKTSDSIIDDRKDLIFLRKLEKSSFIYLTHLSAAIQPINQAFSSVIFQIQRGHVLGCSWVFCLDIFLSKRYYFL